MTVHDFHQARRLRSVTTALKAISQVQSKLPELDETARNKLAGEAEKFFHTGERGISLFHDLVREKALGLLVRLGATDALARIGQTDGSGPLRGMAQDLLRDIAAEPDAQGSGAAAQRHRARLSSKHGL